jgi:hypothetical protein
MSASPLNRRSAALYGAELTQPGYQQRIAESQKNPHTRQNARPKILRAVRISELTAYARM